MTEALVNRCARRSAYCNAGAEMETLSTQGLRDTIYDTARFRQVQGESGFLNPVEVFRCPSAPLSGSKNENPATRASSSTHRLRRLRLGSDISKCVSNPFSPVSPHHHMSSATRHTPSVHSTSSNPQRLSETCHHTVALCL